MGISKIISAIPEIASKCKVYSNSKVVKNCVEAGHEFATIAKQNEGNLNIEQLNSVYKRFLPKGCNIEATNDPQKVAKFLTDMKFDQDTVSFLSNNAQACVIKNFKGETLFFTPIEKFAGDKAVNTATHEFEHALNQNVTFKAKLQNLRVKVLGPKRVEKMALKDAEAVNKKLIKLQQDLIGTKLRISNPLEGTIPQNADAKGLLEYMRVPSQNRLDVKLRTSVRRVLDPKAERKNIKYLKTIKEALSDEARAHRAGGQTAKEYLGLQEGSTMSEMTSQLFDETVGIIKKEIKSQRKKRFKRALGMKVRNYEGKSHKVKIGNYFNAKQVNPNEIHENAPAALFKE